MKTKFLHKTFFEQCRSQPSEENMHARQCSFKFYKTDYCHLLKQNFKNQIQRVSPVFSDINPIENLWSIIKRYVDENGKQQSSKDLWEGIKTATSNIKTIRKKNSTNETWMKLIKYEGANINT